MVQKAENVTLYGNVFRNGNCYAKGTKEARRNRKGRDRSRPFHLDSFGAGNRTRTGDINLGKVALYQLSYSRLRRRAL
jgi:hypothetical protein